MTKLPRQSIKPSRTREELSSRRGFVSGLGSLAAGVSLGVGANESRGSVDAPSHEPGFSNYGRPSGHEREVVRWISANSGISTNGISWSPLHELEGTTTPNGLHYERHHNGIPDIDPDQHEIVLHGLVDKPLAFSISNLLRYPMRSERVFIECGGNSNAGWRRKPIQTAAGYFHGLVSCAEWTGVPMSVLLEEAGLKASAKWLVAEGADKFAMHVSVPLEKIIDDAFIGLYQNGERLRPENGYPARLIVPGWEGVLHVKWLQRMELSAEPAMARNETARYTELGRDGRARMFTFVMEAKSLITSPSATQSLHGPGWYEISGLAWSGRGKIAAVDVSVDGGESWHEAVLDQPVLPRHFTRFRLPWNWDGSVTVLKSRARDETGYVQPEREVLVEQRGRHGYFHYNAQVAWEVDSEGYVSHVYA